MGKGNNRRANKEVKKPKQEKAKASATAGTASSSPISLREEKKTKCSKNGADAIRPPHLFVNTRCFRSCSQPREANRAERFVSPD